MYFSLVTITSLGYGDLAPVGEVARAAAAGAAVLGQIYLVFIVARLVALYTAFGSVIGRASRAKEDRRT
jgi:Na+-driven multidrug efflux pump